MSRLRALWRHLNSRPAPAATTGVTNFATTLNTLDYAHLAAPFADGVVNSSDLTSLNGLDLAHLGAPFAPGVT